MEQRYKREVINNFPYPIASCFTRLYTRQCKNAGADRLIHLFGTAEITSRYLASIVISECREYMEVHPELTEQFPLPFTKKIKSTPFSQHIKRPSWGQWIGFIRDGLKWLHQHQVDLIMPELHHFWFTKNLEPTEAAQAFNRLVNMRNNEIGHNLRTLYENEYPPLCTEVWEKLTIILEALRFLPDYELRFIHEIKVHNIRRQPVVYLHEYSYAVGSSDSFEADDENQAELLESEATLLLNPQNHRYLNLEPLIIYESTAGNAPDVFFYEKMDSPENARYAACHHGGSFKMNKKDPAQNTLRRERMVEELHHLLGLFSHSND